MWNYFYVGSQRLEKSSFHHWRLLQQFSLQHRSINHTSSQSKTHCPANDSEVLLKTKILKSNPYFSTMQAQLTQRDHDNLIKQKIEQDNQPEKSASDTQKKRAACKYNKKIKKTFNF